MYVYLVRQTQPEVYFEDKTIYVCSTKEKAIQYCRELNKQYGKNVEFNTDWDFVDLYDDCDYETVHFYDWKAMELDKPLA